MATTNTERTRAFREVRKEGTIREVQFNTWLPESVAKRITAIAQRDGITKRGVIERAVENMK
jgi:hypothetical protein